MNFILKIFSRLRFIKAKMVIDEPLKVSSLLLPPSEIRGMKVWDPSAFKKSVILPHIDLPAKNISKKKAGSLLRNSRLKIPNFLAIVELDEGKKRVILDPDQFDKFSEDDKTVLKEEYEGCFGES